jgi:hypothetical protein
MELGRASCHDLHIKNAPETASSQNQRERSFQTKLHRNTPPNTNQDSLQKRNFILLTLCPTTHSMVFCVTCKYRWRVLLGWVKLRVLCMFRSPIISAFIYKTIRRIRC